MPIILCIDPGTAHTGLAISEEGILAEPLDTIFERDIDKLVGKLTPFIARLNPEKVVIGQPDHGPLLLYARQLKDRIEKIYAGEVILFPEDLSSKIAQSKMKQSGKNSIQIKKGEHQTAAALILQEYLDS
ncbi:MAG TPA: Holliday junction resolvase RuvX [Patescibacteria group bacterium]